MFGFVYYIINIKNICIKCTEKYTKNINKTRLFIANGQKCTKGKLFMQKG